MYSQFDSHYSSRTINAEAGTRQILEAMKRVKSTLPGPGSYETQNLSSCGSTAHTRKMNLNRSNAHIKSIKSGLMASPSHSGIHDSSRLLVGTQSTPGLGFGSSAGKCDAPGTNGSNANQKLANLSIPTIPSRFLTPILKFDLNEKDQCYDLYDAVVGAHQGGGQPDSVLVAKVARLTNDGAGVGPATYNPGAAYSALNSKGSTTNMAVASNRKDYFTINSTAPKVGPGSYTIKHGVDRSIKNPTMGRKEIYRTAEKRFKRRKNRGSIRADFEEGDTTSDEEPLPGPGHHLQDHHVTTFNKQSYLHDHPQQFGACQSRFAQTKQANNLGPGQYLS